MPSVVYEFLWQDCLYEGGFRTVSIHRTKIGAYKAMKRYVFHEWYEARNLGLSYGSFSRKKDCLEAQRWKVVETELLE